MSEALTPYENLGSTLRGLRERHSESLAEVSGAVEIDEHKLERIEAGQERPPEEILLLLISHFDMQDREALRLWELAGYDGDIPEELQPDQTSTELKQIMVVLGIDARAIYSDGANVLANKQGLHLTFTQRTGDQDVPVARVGMSYEQAQEVLKILHRAVLDHRYNSGPHELPPNVA